MVQYNPKDWFTFIFRFHKSDTFRQLFPMMVAIGLYSYAIGYLEIEYWKLSERDQLKNITVMHSTLGFVISLLLAYRTNTAYDRWWEGRKIWGQLTNISRNFALKMATILEHENDKKYFRTILPIFANELAIYLKKEKTSKMLWEEDELEKQVQSEIDQQKHIPLQIVKLLHSKVQRLYQEKKLTNEQILFIKDDLTAFTDVIGASERIKNTPIPYSYSAFIKKFIFVYIMTLPFGYVFNLGYYVIPVVVFIFYVLASLELIAEEIEDPFGSDPNDLPIDAIASNIKKYVSEIL